MKTYILNGLDCAHCAEKIERAVNNIDGVKGAKLNFISKRLDVDADGKKALEEVKKTVLKIEPDVRISEEESDGQGEKIMILRILSAFAIFILGFFIKNSFTPLIFLSAYVIIGTDVLIKAIKGMKGLRFFDENFLMSIATAGALIIGEYPEAAAVMIFYQIGEFFQNAAVRKSRNSVKALMMLAPEYAETEENGKIISKKPEQLNPGDIMIVRPGGKIALDGEVCDGCGDIDVSALTGESLPVFVEKGSMVCGGSINRASLLKIRVTKPYTESTVAKIMELVLGAADKKSAPEKFITKFSGYYTPCIVTAAVLLAVIGSVVAANPSEWIYRSLQFLVISCPCALVISVPLSFWGGIGRAAREGILIKGSGCLEKIASAKTVVFDKTGTLTEGKFTVGGIRCAGEVNEDELLKIAASVERLSAHPVAKGIAEAYAGEPYPAEDITEKAGRGITGKINGKTVFLGNAAHMHDNGISCEDSGKTAVHVAMDGKYIGCIFPEDKIRKESIGLAQKLKKAGVKCVAVLSGDNEAAVRVVAEKTGADLYYASLMPQDKVRICMELKKQGAFMFVGDGINDAPVIAMSDIGAAMGKTGSDIATEAADVVFMKDDPSKALKAIEIVGKTIFRVKQNIFFVLGIKMIILILGAFGITSMWTAVFADVGVSLLAVMNAVRK